MTQRYGAVLVNNVVVNRVLLEPDWDATTGQRIPGAVIMETQGKEKLGDQLIDGKLMRAVDKGGSIEWIDPENPPAKQIDKIALAQKIRTKMLDRRIDADVKDIVMALVSKDNLKLQAFEEKIQSLRNEHENAATLLESLDSSDLQGIQTLLDTLRKGSGQP